SYTPRSPAVMRALRVGYDPFGQVRTRLEHYKAMGHSRDKIELIVMGGTFLQYPLDYQYSFIKRCYDALNGKEARNLAVAKKINERAKHRCVALCIETRPDNCTENDIKRMLDFGTTRVELGIQMPDDQLYAITKRGHSVRDVVEATARLKDCGFKVGYHIMPGLPGSTPEKDLAMFKQIFDDENFRPDQVKIYPTQVVKGAELAEWYAQGIYEPYSDHVIEELLEKMILMVPEYCRVMRIMREIPPMYLVAGTKWVNFRAKIEEKLRKKHRADVKEIRLREIGLAMRDGVKIDQKIEIKVLPYAASKGKEYFISVVNNQNILFGLCRLRIPHKTFLPELHDAALVRELHVYGQTVGLKDVIDKVCADTTMLRVWQHKGLGKRLMEEAERIAKEEGMRRIAVISGVGVREYYRKLGYRLNGSYMCKTLG
ncbi:MAG: tRNA uridine(34) 5-carboxymethylaminomethyl modification radical SAM/GNAT enzyme Elp3, partial [Candidatus Woesearchaeota archaeon]